MLCFCISCYYLFSTSSTQLLSLLVRLPRQVSYVHTNPAPCAASFLLPCWQVASDVLTGGRSARLIKQLVLRGSCLSASVLVGYPGDLHPGLSLVTAVPPQGEAGLYDLTAWCW
jgi:hypothetical protein